MKVGSITSKQGSFCSSFNKNFSVHTNLIAGFLQFNYMHRWQMSAFVLMSRCLPTLLAHESSLVKQGRTCRRLQSSDYSLLSLLYILFAAGKSTQTSSALYTPISLPNITENSLHLSKVQAIISIIF